MEVKKDTYYYIHTCYQSFINFWKNLRYCDHLILSIILRLLLVGYGEIQDNVAQVGYTDIDYRVVTDGARHILTGGSPFERHTYRYSPIMAYLQLVNIIINPVAGKLVYMIFDILVALLIYSIVRREISLQYLANSQKPSSMLYEYKYLEIAERYALLAFCFWLYNPLTAVISTRGNGDCFSSFFIIGTIYLILSASSIMNETETSAKSSRHHLMWIFIAGCVHGFSIHLRLYPIFFSMAYYLFFSGRQLLLANEKSTRMICRQLLLFLWPNAEQLALIVGTGIGLMLPIMIFYYLYGWIFIHETYLYHFMRRDIRHNFSLYFLMQYLDNEDIPSIMPNNRFFSIVTLIIKKVLVMSPQLILILFASYCLSQSRFMMPFCIFLITAVLVTYNTVVTSQYFVWYLALLPLSLHNFYQISKREAAVCIVGWFIVQGLWLLPAYLLEFHAWNTFNWIGIQGMILFIYHNLVLLCLLKRYNFITCERVVHKFN